MSVANIISKLMQPDEMEESMVYVYMSKGWEYTVNQLWSNSTFGRR